MKNYEDAGEIVTVSAPGALTAGDIFVWGNIVVAAVSSAAAPGEAIPALVRGRVTAKKAAGSIAPGVWVYWDDTAKRVTTTATGNTLMGFHAGQTTNAGAAGSDIDVILWPMKG